MLSRVFSRKFRATFSTNEKQKQNQLCLARPRFPALGAGYTYLLRTLIGSLRFTSVIGQSNYFGFGFTTPSWNQWKTLEKFVVQTVLRFYLGVQLRTRGPRNCTAILRLYWRVHGTYLLENNVTPETLGNVRNDNSDGNENVSRKYNFILFVQLRDYFNSPNLRKKGELNTNQFGGSGVRVKKKNEKFAVVCSRSQQSLELGHFTLLGTLSSDDDNVNENVRKQ